MVYALVIAKVFELPRKSIHDCSESVLRIFGSKLVASKEVTLSRICFSSSWVYFVEKSFVILPLHRLLGEISEWFWLVDSISV
jgi:hypothetical protein